jgi:hypothetical protein
MAYVYGGLDRIKLKFPDLDLKKMRLIGWGAGQYFTDYFPHTGLNLEYTICPYPENQNKVINGIKVRDPSALNTESTENILIVVFSASWPLIFKQIHEIKSFKVIAGVGFNDNISLINKLINFQQTFKHFNIAVESKFKLNKSLGIFTQGPITDQTELCLAHTKINFPNYYNCFITDEGQDANKLEKCRKWCDELIIVQKPLKNTSYLNTNLMLRTCKIGAEHIYTKGFKYSLRLRSDSILHGDIEESINLLEEDNQKKICIADNGWKHLPFHFSDMLMMGNSEEILKVWSCPEDPRPCNHPEFNPDNKSHFSKIEGVAPECYIWKTYAASRGMSNKTIEDSILFAKNCLSSFKGHLNFFSIKAIPFFSLKFNESPNTDESWWNEVYGNTSRLITDEKRIFDSAWTIEDFFKNRVH